MTDQYKKIWDDIKREKNSFVTVKEYDEYFKKSQEDKREFSEKILDLPFAVRARIIHHLIIEEIR